MHYRRLNVLHSRKSSECITCRQGSAKPSANTLVPVSESSPANTLVPVPVPVSANTLVPIPIQTTQLSPLTPQLNPQLNSTQIKTMMALQMQQTTMTQTGGSGDECNSCIPATQSMPQVQVFSCPRFKPSSHILLVDRFFIQRRGCCVRLNLTLAEKIYRFTA